MKYLFVLFFLTGCAVHAADLSNKPRGEDVFNALLKNVDTNLVNEPRCYSKTSLNELLSLALSVSYYDNNKTVIKSSCSLSEHELSAENIIDVWDCTIQIHEDNLKGEFISSSTFVFSLTIDTKEFIKGSLRCR